PGCSRTAAIGSWAEIRSIWIRWGRSTGLPPRVISCSSCNNRHRPGMAEGKSVALLSSREKVPAISVLMPTFNRLQFLPPTIGSVFAQTVTDWELIIADDGSDEDTRAYLRSIPDPRVR